MEGHHEVLHLPLLVERERSTRRFDFQVFFVSSFEIQKEFEKIQNISETPTIKKCQAVRRKT